MKVMSSTYSMYDCSYTNQLLIQHEFLISYNHNTCKSKKKHVNARVPLSSQGQCLN